MGLNGGIRHWVWFYLNFQVHTTQRNTWGFEEGEERDLCSFFGILQNLKSCPAPMTIYSVFPFSLTNHYLHRKSFKHIKYTTSWNLSTWGPGNSPWSWHVDILWTQKLLLQFSVKQISVLCLRYITQVLSF